MPIRTRSILGFIMDNCHAKPSLANEPDPVWLACLFSKSHKRSHKCDTGHIAAHHKTPGKGISSDGMEASCPGWPLTMHGLPTNHKYKYATFWFDHYLEFMHVTLHETEKVEELFCSKEEFEDLLPIMVYVSKAFEWTLWYTWRESCRTPVINNSSNSPSM